MIFICRRCEKIFEQTQKNGPWYCDGCYEIEKKEIKEKGLWSDFQWKQ